MDHSDFSTVHLKSRMGEDKTIMMVNGFHCFVDRFTIYAIKKIEESNFDETRMIKCHQRNVTTSFIHRNILYLHAAIFYN